MADELDAIRVVLERARPQLHGCANVVATGIGYKISRKQRTSEISIACSVVKKVPAAELSPKDLVPPRIDGVATDVVKSGLLRAFQSRTERRRPAPGGVSIGHAAVTAGTLGFLVKRDGQTFVLSNNHVLANSNDSVPGDPILQPGRFDGGRLPDDRLAELEEFVPIRFAQPPPPSECPTARAVIAVLNATCRLIGSRTRYQIVSLQAEDNLVDAAIARPLNAGDVSPEILEIGTVRGVAEAELGTTVRKSGRTTGLTTGEIRQVDVTADVDYGAGRTARFRDQLLAGAMSQGGDSGSAVLDAEDRVVGLLFAGSETTTLINRIGRVLSALRVGV